MEVSSCMQIPIHSILFVYAMCYDTICYHLTLYSFHCFGKLYIYIGVCIYAYVMYLHIFADPSLQGVGLAASLGQSVPAPPPASRRWPHLPELDASSGLGVWSS